MTIKIDFANQISNLLSRFLPYTNQIIGDRYEAVTFGITSNKLTITLNPADYLELSSKINNTQKPRTQYSISGITLKNTLLSFSSYPKNCYLGGQFGFSAKFKLPHKYKKGQLVTLKGFTDVNYNIEYKVIKTIGKKEAVLFPNSIVTIEDIVVGLGFSPVNFTSGFNNSQILIDEGSDQVSFLFDENLTYTTTDINNIDQDFPLVISDYQDVIKVMSLETFKRNLTNQPNTDYLIIDTTSLVGTPLRSNSNNSDANYISYTVGSGFFDKNYSINISYILQRKDNDDDNQTDSGSDIVEKQINMGDVITSIIRVSLCADETRIMSNMTIANDSVPEYISEGAVQIDYKIEFTSSYLPAILIDKDPDNKYPINFVKINSDELDFS